MDIIEIAREAKNAFLNTMTLDNEVKNEALRKIAIEIENNKELIFEANAKDLLEAQKMLEKGEINKATFDRLKLNEQKLRDLIKGLNDLTNLDDPVNSVLWAKELDKGLVLKKISVPIGVIGVIFEARPDCFIQIASLLIKSGNCGILKGGKEANNTNKVFNEILQNALKKVACYPTSAISLVYERDDIKKMLDLDEYISLIIPRGGNALVKFIKENTKIPVLGHASGICHIFLDADYDLDDAKRIIIDAKTQYPSACNAVETLLIHKDFKFINELKSALVEAGIKLIEDSKDYATEYGDKILAIKTVDDLDSAMAHINKFGSGHTDSILSKDEKNIEKFMNLVDSSSVMANCSTRFSDGFRYGFGAEVGISTNKTHARGPVGLEGLTIYKYKLFGSGDIVADYANGSKSFCHKFLPDSIARQ